VLENLLVYRLRLSLLNREVLRALLHMAGDNRTVILAVPGLLAFALAALAVERLALALLRREQWVRRRRGVWGPGLGRLGANDVASAWGGRVASRRVRCPVSCSRPLPRLPSPAASSTRRRRSAPRARRRKSPRCGARRSGARRGTSWGSWCRSPLPTALRACCCPATSCFI
jgi:hypothetical protein